MTRDDESVVCPHCGYKHGDPWEWCASSTPSLYTCDECGGAFKAWAEYDVQYVTIPLPRATSNNRQPYNNPSKTGQEEISDENP